MTGYLFGAPTTTPADAASSAEALPTAVPGTAPPETAPPETAPPETAPPGTALPTASADVPAATPRWMWRVALLALVGTLIARMPALRDRVAVLLADAPAVTEELTDDHLRELALNVGLGLAVLLSAVLYLIYQSLGRALERHVFTRSVRWGRTRAGLFFLVAAAATLPPALLAALLGQPSVRDHVGFYAWVVVVGLVAPLPFRRYWRSVTRSRKVVLFAAAVTFALMGTLI